jgi:hypothetical protein
VQLFNIKLINIDEAHQEHGAAFKSRCDQGEGHSTEKPPAAQSQVESILGHVVVDADAG